jgi:hypothetical protein
MQGGGRVARRNGPVARSTQITLEPLPESLTCFFDHTRQSPNRISAGFSTMLL